MNNQELKNIAGKRIAETLELLELSGISRKEIDIIRKGYWRFFDEIMLIQKVSTNDKIKR